MEKFNTHGGYFAPRGYTRVNEGGSHEENPNGGVQLGVDQNGVPNMLEENEPVYDDFVFSDNIKADKKFLKDNKISDKYAGKLYSEIVDSLMEEAEERPFDAVSNNGIRVMLSRLANAQEAQKQAESAKEIESELSKLSPEELAQLEQILASEQGAGEQEVQQAQIQPQVVEQPEIGMMACGGGLRRFDEGGTKPLVSYGGTIPAARVTAYHPFTQSVIDSRGEFLRSAKEVFDEAKTPLYVVPGVGKVIMAVDAIEGIANGDESAAALAAIPFMKPIKAVAGTAKAVKAAAPSVLKAVGKGISKVNSAIPSSKVGKIAWGITEPGGYLLRKWNPQSINGNLGKIASRAIIDNAYYGGIGGGIYGISNAYRSPFTDAEKQEAANSEYTFDFSPLYDEYAFGGRINKYNLGGGPFKFLWDGIQEPKNFVEDNTRTANPPQVSGTSTTKSGQTNKGALVTQKQTSQQTTQPPKRDLLRDFGPKLVEPETTLDDIIRSKGADMASSPLAKNTINTSTLPKITGTRPQIPDQKSDYSYLFRYAPAITSAIKGLYNAFQEPDHYELPKYSPVLPTGEMHLTDPTFVPLDTNMLVNNILSGHAGTIRQLRNSGIGPSTDAAIIAADNNLSNSVGTAMSGIAQTNNQMRNAVIGQRNANAQALANFNYGIDSERARILNDMMQRNQQNSLMIQRLNNDAETQKYAAIGNELDKVAQGLSGIGTENMRTNAANSMFDYVRLADGRTAFIPKVNQSKLGGTLLRKCK